MSNDPFIVITADTHAGASIEAYRSTSTRSTGTTSTPGAAATKTRPKSTSAARRTRTGIPQERLADLLSDGVVGEVIFPNTVPPFYDAAFHISPPPAPAQYEHQLAGMRAHNRWLAEFCAEAPERRAGIGLIHLNNIDDAIEDVQWIAKNNLRGGVLLPLPSPSEVHLKPLNHPDYDRLWAAIQDCDLVMNQHSGPGLARLRGWPGVQGPVGNGDVVLHPARLHPPDHGRRVRALPEAALHPHRIRLRLGAEADAADGRHVHGVEGGLYRRNRHLERSCAQGAAELLRQTQLLVRRQLPVRRRRQWPDAVGVDQRTVGQRLPALRRLLPVLAREYALRVRRHRREGSAHDAGRKRRKAVQLRSVDALKALAAEVNITPADVAVPLPLEDIPADSTCITFQRARSR